MIRRPATTVRRLIAYASASILGLAAGVLSAAYAAGLVPGGGMNLGSVNVGGWRSDFAIGTTSADPYTRARVARHGLLALARTEAVYFTTNTDSAGRRLRDTCIYRIGGGPMPAAWWSITLYDRDSRLPMNDDDALSIDATKSGSAKQWTATIAQHRPGRGLWLSSRNGGSFDLTLRLYDPDPALFKAPANVLKAPTVTRVSCADDLS